MSESKLLLISEGDPQEYVSRAEIPLLSEILPELLKGERLVQYIANPGNTGDAVIAHGTAEVFSSLGLELVDDSSTLLIAGGGNLIPRYHNLRKILESLPRRGKRIIILPSTANGCFGLLGEFEDLTLLAREAVTWQLAREAGVNAILCHDAAFDVDYSPWDNDPGADSRQVLWNFRKDGESAGGSGRHKVGNRDLSEEFGNRMWDFASAKEASSRFISEINRYRNVHTDRLHVALVAACLGKAVFLHPNDYHKNRSMFENSLCGFPNFTFVGNGPPWVERAAGFESFLEEVAWNPPCWQEIDEASSCPAAPPRTFGEKPVDFSFLSGPEMPPAGVIELCGARVCGANGLVQTAEGRRLIDLSWPSHRRFGGLTFPEGASGIHIEGRAVLIASPWAGVNYAHYVLDTLGRIGILRAAGIRDEDVDVYLCPRPPSPFADLLMSRANIPLAKMRWLQHDQNLWLKHLQVASFPGAARVYSARGLEWVRSLGRGPRPGKSGRRIFVDRAGQRRDFSNRDELLPMLEEAGFERFGAEGYGRADEVFAEADMVVGIHGAGLANIVFCKRGTKVLEIVPSAWPAPHFFSVAEALGLEYAAIRGFSRGHSGEPNVGYLNTELRVEPETLRDALLWMTTP